MEDSLKVRKHYESFWEEDEGWAKTRNCMAMFSLYPCITPRNMFLNKSKNSPFQ